MSVRRTAALAVAAAVLLAGCQDEPEPGTDPTPSASPSESETTQEPEAQTAEEFIEEWFELNTEMQNTGETEAFLAASPKCRPCARLAAQVSGFYEAGGFVRIESQTVKKVKELSNTEFLVTVDAAPTEYRESSDGTVQRLDGGRTEYRMILKRAGDEWAVAHYFDSTPS